MKKFEDNLINYLAVKLPSDIPSSTIQEIAAYCTAETIIAVNDAVNARDAMWREADKERARRLRSKFNYPGQIVGEKHEG